MAFLARSCIGFISKMDITAQCLGKRSTKPCKSNPACWGKVLDVSCYLVCLMSTYQSGAFELNDSACWGKVLNVSCYPACLMSTYQLGAFELNDSACWGKVLNVSCYLFV